MSRRDKRVENALTNDGRTMIGTPRARGTQRRRDSFHKGLTGRHGG